MEATGAGVQPPQDARTWIRQRLGGATGDWPALALSDVLWYFGAISVVAAAISIVDHVPQSHRDVWEFLVSLGFLTGFALGAWLLSRGGRRLPCGLAAGMAAAMVPAVGYGFTQLVHAYPRQQSFNPFSSFSGAIFAVAVATAAAATLAYVLTRVAVNLALAVVSVLFAAQLLATSWHATVDGRATTAVVVGSLLVATGLLLDAIGRRSEAFWPYAGGFGAVTVALGVYAFPSRHLHVWIAMLVVGTLLLLAFPFVARRTWAVFGTVNLAAAFAVSQVATDGRGGRAIIVGGVVVAAALLLDAAGRRRIAFWLYLGGLAALTAGFALYVFPTQHLHVWIAMLVVGTLLLVGFPFIDRRTWAVFGTVYLAGAYAVSQVATDGRGGRAIVVGVVVVAAALLLDAAGRRAVAFWLYVGGLSAVVEGLIYLAIRSPTSEPWIPMLVVGAALLAGFIAVGRKTWAVFGAALVVGAYATSELTAGDGRAGRALIVSSVVFLVGLGADLRGQRLTGFWLQVAGLWGAASALTYLAGRSSHPETRAWIPMLIVGAILLASASLVQRRTWVVFGAAGVAGAFGHYLITKSSWFHWALLALGLVAFAAGLVADRARAGHAQGDSGADSSPVSQ
jgi:hypothetical protein